MKQGTSEFVSYLTERARGVQNNCEQMQVGGKRLQALLSHRRAASALCKPGPRAQR